jgi:octaprenyl-diphosphate synthase
MTVGRLRALVSQDFNAVNELIIAKIQSDIGLIDSLSHHIIESGGKRLRPLLVLLTSHACGYQGQHHIPLAAMIEFFHTATLLHDDVVDESTLRRGRETANELFGSKASILVGDYLFTQSIQLMISVGHASILALLADTAHRITRGEVKQLTNKQNMTLTEADYFDIIQSKTALLFAAASAIGAHLAEVDEVKRQALYDYGLHLGNAFQLIDDALDFCADTATMGKNTGDDLAEGKLTLPLIHALQHAKPEQQALIKDALIAGDRLHWDAIIAIMAETQSIEYTHQLAQYEVDLAITALQGVDDSPYKTALIDLASFSISRDH